MAEEPAPDFTFLENRVFTQSGTKIFLGREEVKPELKRILSDQAKQFEGTQLYEIINATVTNEAYTIALIQSKDFDQVMSAKMLHHWGHVMRNVIHTLAKLDSK